LWRRNGYGRCASRVLRAGIRVYKGNGRTVVNDAVRPRGSVRRRYGRVAAKTLFTQREREVLEWLNRGKTSWDISVILNISERTVNYHVGNIMRKFGVSSRLLAVSESRKYGLSFE
jgi:DNA-binding CsgD family transcriptional regulator